MAALASALSALVAAIFAIAAVNKILAIGRFREELADYELLPDSLVGLAAIGLPLLELGAAGVTLVPSTRIPGSIALLALLVVFSAAVAINLSRGRDEIRCACFGETSQTLSRVSLFRNGMLAVALVPAIIVPAPTTQFLTLPGILGGLFFACLFWLLLETARSTQIAKAAGETR